MHSEECRLCTHDAALRRHFVYLSFFPKVDPFQYRYALGSSEHLACQMHDTDNSSSTTYMTLIHDDSILVLESEKLPHLASRMFGGKQICISEVVHIHLENVQAYYKTTYDALNCPATC